MERGNQRKETKELLSIKQRKRRRREISRLDSQRASLPKKATRIHQVQVVREMKPESVAREANRECTVSLKVMDRRMVLMIPGLVVRRIFRSVEQSLELN